MSVETSILLSTKRVLGIPDDYPVYDLDIITFINTAFSTLNQLGVGPENGFAVESDIEEWDDYFVPLNQLQTVKTYVYLRVRQLFDPPSIGFLSTAMENQVKELEWRLNVFREWENRPVEVE